MWFSDDRVLFYAYFNFYFNLLECKDLSMFEILSLFTGVNELGTFESKCSICISSSAKNNTILSKSHWMVMVSPRVTDGFVILPCCISAGALQVTSTIYEYGYLKYLHVMYQRANATLYLCTAFI